MKASIVTGIVALGLLPIAGCDRGSADGPPNLRLGEDVCVQCNMIISDVRWATATVVEGPRGSEARLFDDFNCQINFEVEHQDVVIVDRWSHDHATSQWMPTSEATFLMAEKLRTPMGSRMAAFADAQSADKAASNVPGDILNFETAWQRLGYAGVPCHHETDHEGGGK